ncbi:MAG: DUF6249 domain-containing protein [Paludibacteraceae bacterium]
MKKIGFLLLSFVLWMGVNAEQKPVTSLKTDTSKTVVVKDSSEQLYLNKNLDPKEAILLQKLTSEQIMQLERQRMENDKINDMPFSKFGLLLICLAPFILVVFIILLASSYKNKESIRKHELYMKAIEAGQSVPDTYFKEPEKSKTSNLQKGAVWLAVGLGITILLLVSDNIEKSGVGAIPAFVGIAYLLVHFLEKPKKELPEEK